MKMFTSVLLVVALVLSFSVSVFAANEQPSGTSYSAPQSYSSSVITTKDFWTALTNAATGVYYRLGNTTQSGSVLYILNNIYTRLGSTTQSGTIIGLLNQIKENTASSGSGSSVSSAWTFTQAVDVTTNTNTIKTTLTNIYSKLLEMSSSSSSSSAWSSSDVTDVKNYLYNTQSNSNYLDDIAGYTQTSKLKLTDIAAWEAFIQSISNNTSTIKNNTLYLDEKLDDIVTNTSDTAGNTFNLMTRLHYLDSAAWDEGGAGFSPDSWWYNMYLRLFGTYIEATGIHDDTTAILPHTDSIDTHTQSIDSTTQNLYSLLTSVPSKFSVYFPYYNSSTGEPTSTSSATGSTSFTPMIPVFRNGKWGYQANEPDTLMEYISYLCNEISQQSSMFFTLNRPYSTFVTDYSSGVTSSHVAASLADFFQEYGTSISDGVSRLSYMLADDDDIALKHSQADNIEAVHSDFLSGQDSPTSIGVGSIGAVKGFGDSLHDIFNVGSINPSSFFGILSASEAWSFFTSMTRSNIGMQPSPHNPGEPGPGPGPMFAKSFAASLDSTDSEVEVIDFYQQNIDELHSYLEVMSID